MIVKPFGLLRPQDVGAGYIYPANALYPETGVDSADELITTQDYIPVASASELNALRNSVTQTMGAGTPWEGQYTTGLDKKYVQVAEINVNGMFTRFNTFSGIFDGNLLNINNFIISASSNNSSMFSSLSNAILRNFIGSGEISQTNNAASTCGLIGNCIDSVVDNCVFTGVINNAGNSTGGLVAVVQGKSIIKNSQVNATINGDGLYIGGICGYAIDTVTIENCETLGTINSKNDYTGGIIGRILNSVIVKQCKSYCDIINVDTLIHGTFGGICGNNQNIINDCYFNGTIKGLINNIGGLIGYNQGTITNCYSIGLVDEALGSLNFGGFCGLNSGTITNSYWDTETSGQATSAGGTGKTTTEMKSGGIDDSAIYVGWAGVTASEPVWDDIDTNSYPELIVFL